MTNKQSSIDGEILLLCERVDIAQFISVYIKLLKKDGYDIADCRIINFQGLGRFGSCLEKLQAAEGSEKIKKAVIFADATDAIRTRNLALYRAVNHSFLKDIGDTGYFMLPGKRPTGRWNKGYLEDLLLQALHPDSECSYLRNMAEDYMLSVNNTRGKENFFVNQSRYLLCACLAGMRRFAGLRLAEAAHLGAFDLEHEGFDSLRKCLCSL